MKQILFSLVVLIFASPAWAEGAKPAANPDIPKGVSIKVSGAADGVAKLVASLKASKVYKAAKCGKPAAVGGETIINCKKDTTKELEDFFFKNTPQEVKVGLEHGGKLLCNGQAACYIMPCPSAVTCCRPPPPSYAAC